MGFGKDGKGVMITDVDIITLGALANNAVIKQDNPIGLTEDFRLIKTKLWGALDAHTEAEGPVLLGVADNELTTQEISDAINTGGPVDRNDRSKQEQATRPVWILDVMYPDTEGDGKVTSIVEETIRWTFSNDEAYTFFIMNISGATLTTGAIFRFAHKDFGVWVT